MFISVDDFATISVQKPPKIKSYSSYILGVMLNCCIVTYKIVKVISKTINTLHVKFVLV